MAMLPHRFAEDELSGAHSAPGGRELAGHVLDAVDEPRQQARGLACDLQIGQPPELPTGVELGAGKPTSENRRYVTYTPSITPTISRIS